MMAVIGSMAAILVHERKRIREIEAGTETIRQVRRETHQGDRSRHGNHPAGAP